MRLKALSTGNFKIATLQPITQDSYQKNLEYLIDYIQSSNAELIVAPELFLTNFDYDNFDKASCFYEEAMAKLLTLAPKKIIVLTLNRKIDKQYVNQAVVLYNNRVIHQQNKYKLFKLGNEEKYFKAGEAREVVTFSINSINYALLICFELRFKELWKQVERADIILVPARWGKSRKKHLEILSQALAIMNQAFVVVSNSADDDMASSSAIISPWGEVNRNDKAEVLESSIQLDEVKKIRRIIRMY